MQDEQEGQEIDIREIRQEVRRAWTRTLSRLEETEETLPKVKSIGLTHWLHMGNDRQIRKTAKVLCLHNWKIAAILTYSCNCKGREIWFLTCFMTVLFRVSFKIGTWRYHWWSCQQRRDRWATYTPTWLSWGAASWGSLLLMSTYPILHANHPLIGMSRPDYNEANLFLYNAESPVRNVLLLSLHILLSLQGTHQVLVLLKCFSIHLSPHMVSSLNFYYF